MGEDTQDRSSLHARKTEGVTEEAFTKAVGLVNADNQEMTSSSKRDPSIVQKVPLRV